MANIVDLVAYATNNGAYKAKKQMIPQGIVVHSTGCNNPTLKRYVNAPEFCGVNVNKNYWDNASSTVCPHGVIGLDINNEVKSVQVLPWTIRCYGCGTGRLGSYNTSYIQFEICEDNLTNKNYFDRVFDKAIQLVADLIKKYNIKLENVVSHKEAYTRGYASNHGDPDHWLAKYGKNMDWFRSEVNKRINNPNKYTVKKFAGSEPLGVFNNLDAAKDLADYNVGCKVWDINDKVIYTPKTYCVKYKVITKAAVKLEPTKTGKTQMFLPVSTKITVYYGSNKPAENGTIWVKFTSPECDKFPNKFAWIPLKYLEKE